MKANTCLISYWQFTSLAWFGNNESSIQWNDSSIALVSLRMQQKGQCSVFLSFIKVQWLSAGMCCIDIATLSDKILVLCVIHLYVHQRKAPKKKPNNRALLQDAYSRTDMDLFYGLFSQILEAGRDRAVLE